MVESNKLPMVNIRNTDRNTWLKFTQIVKIKKRTVWKELEGPLKSYIKRNEKYLTQ